jgi:hypothetical protein
VCLEIKRSRNCLFNGQRDKDFETEKDSKVDLIKSFGDNRSAEDILEVGYEGPHSVLSLYMLG